MIRGTTAPEDPDTYSVTPRGTADVPEIVAIVPKPKLGLMAQLWVPDVVDLPPPKPRDRHSDGFFGKDRWVAGPPAAPGQPVPVDPEPSAMPADNRLRLDDAESAGPARPEAAQDDPECSVGGTDD